MKVKLSDCGKKLIITKEIDSSGDLDFRGTGIASLPDGLQHVGGYLGLRDTGIASLPDSLQYVGGYLDLRGTGIKTLPKNLTVKGAIYMDD